jgi:hypothetical protein
MERILNYYRLLLYGLRFDGKSLFMKFHAVLVAAAENGCDFGIWS